MVDLGLMIMPDFFSEKEKEILSPFVTNLDKDVFVLKNLPEVVKGALFSRYSRSAKTLRRLLLEEFILNKESGFESIVSHQKDSGESEVVAIQKAEDFYDRVLVGYGDDSVAELGGAHLAVENASNILSKIIEDSRIGLSPLEKSTRYVFFDQKINNRCQYYLEPDIMASRFADEYTGLCDELFGEYAKLIPSTKKFLEEKFPRDENTSERAYNSTIKAKTCDILRVFLPASTYTNMGVFGNGRAFEYLLTKMYSEELKEPRLVADEIFLELSKTIPSFVKTAKGKYGEQAAAYLHETKKTVCEIALQELPNVSPQNSNEVELVGFDENALEKIVAAVLYPSSDLSFGQIKKIVQKMPYEKKKEIFDNALLHRTNRRHKLLRGFEHAFYEFDLLGNFGIYRDLQRHRVLTQQRQVLGVKHGFDTPKEFFELGIQKNYAELMQKASDLYDKVSKKMLLQAQYVVPFGYKLRWAVSINLRELFHLVELRSGIQGHVDYRRIALKMLEEAQKAHPFLEGKMKFADYREIELSRLEAEKKTDEKISKIMAKEPKSA